MGLLEKIKQDAQKSGTNKGKFIFIKDGDKKRIRFLTDMEDGFEVVFHDNFEANINIPCQEIFGRSCQYCDEEGIRTRSMYAWSVWDYESKEVKLFMYAVNNCSPINALAAMYENYGTLLDRDYIVSVTGKQKDKTFGVVPMDKAKFRNDKAKPYSHSAFLKILDKAYPDEHSDLSIGKSKNKSGKNDDFMNEPENDYSEMTPKQLYNLCEEREIECEPKMKAKYYIDLLQEYDEENSDDWDDEDESNDIDYDSMSPKKLYDLCMERNIEALPKKNQKYYINLLKENDKVKDDWDDEDDLPWEEEYE